MPELDIQTIFAILLRKIKWIILFAVVGGLLFGLYAHFFIPETYRSECEMYISNYKDIATTKSEGMSSASLNASQTLVNEYIVVIRNDMMMSKVSQELQKHGYSLSAGTLRGMLSLSEVNETAMLRVSAVTTDPDLSKAICQSVMDVAPDELTDIMPLSTIRPMAPPKTGYRVGPNVTRNVIIGAAIGLLVTCGLVIVLYMLDDTVKGERDLKRRMDVVVLGEVPSFQNDKKGGKHHGKRK